MRTNNEKIKNVIISIYFILIVLAILLGTVFSIFKDLTPNPFLTFFILLFAFALAFFIVHKISRYFEYDSDGQQVIIINRGLLLADYFNYREHKIEFDKEDLVGFKFQNFFFYTQLVVYLKSSRGKNKTETFNVTMVARKKRRYVRQSLSKIIKLNKKNTSI